MQHVDALSRCHNILVLTDNTFEQVLSIKQQSDPNIIKICDILETSQSPYYELRDGLEYKKNKKQLLFYVPDSMIRNVVRMYHDNFEHVGVDKTCNFTLKTYWYPSLQELVKNYISNCLKCMSFNPHYGKSQGEQHNIEKGKKPFDTYHIDHYRSFEKTRGGYKYILLVIDAFTKYVKLYPCRSTKSSEVIKHMKVYLTVYSKPKRIISDRGACFTSGAFKEFLGEENVKHVLIATTCPWANGQAERMLGPMIAKLCESSDKWDKVLNEVEFAINNTVNKSTGVAPARLLFGIEQGSNCSDNVREYLNEELQSQSEDTEIANIRDEAANNIRKMQEINKKLYDKNHSKPMKYNVGDKVLITNADLTHGVSKKLLPKFKELYEVEVVLPNDRYVLKDVDGHQVTQIPFHSTVGVSHMKPWLNDNT